MKLSFSWLTKIIPFMHRSEMKLHSLDRAIAMSKGSALSVKRCIYPALLIQENLMTFLNKSIDFGSDQIPISSRSEVERDLLSAFLMSMHFSFENTIKMLLALSGHGAILDKENLIKTHDLKALFLLAAQTENLDPKVFSENSMHILILSYIQKFAIDGRYSTGVTGKPILLELIPGVPIVDADWGNGLNFIKTSTLVLSLFRQIINDITWRIRFYIFEPNIPDGNVALEIFYSKDPLFDKASRKIYWKNHAKAKAIHIQEVQKLNEQRFKLWQEITISKSLNGNPTELVEKLVNPKIPQNIKHGPYLMGVIVVNAFEDALETIQQVSSRVESALTQKEKTIIKPIAKISKSRKTKLSILKSNRIKLQERANSNP
jgi:hypothetical protein